MKNKINNSFLIISILIVLNLSVSCQKNPATGQNEINIMSENEEDLIGKNEHSKILIQFGGEFKDKKLNNYIKSLGNFLVSTSELPEKKFTFTILNTPIINAFALPGGYIYLTRGLIYLCQNEAQLAGVIAHEIGHITAKHSAKRYTKTVGTGILLQVLNLFSNNPFLGNLFGQSAQLFLLSYSRSQEYQADQLAVRYMIRAGFDPNEMANFLRLMEEFANLQKKVLKIENEISELLKTHPNSSKRVQEVINTYKRDIPLNPIIGKDIFLKKIDGLLYGHKEEEGFFMKNNFVHKPLKIKFNFDKDFYFLNNPKALIGTSKKTTKIIFDLEETSYQNNLDYLAKWASTSKKNISEFKSFVNNDFKISRGKIKKKKGIVIVATLKDDRDIIFRFSLLSNKKELKLFEEKFNETVMSFTKIKEEELDLLSPPKIKIVSSNSQPEFIDNIIREINLQKMHSDDFFKVINDIQTKEFEIGAKLKSIY
jgi:predicted Zn-dependent protease